MPKSDPIVGKAWHSEYQVAVTRTAVGFGIVVFVHLAWLLFGQALLRWGFPLPKSLPERLTFACLSLLPLAYAASGVRLLLQCSLELANETRSANARCYWCSYELDYVPALSGVGSNDHLVRCPECGTVNSRGRIPASSRRLLNGSDLAQLRRLRRTRRVLLGIVSALQFWKEGGSIFSAISLLLKFAFCAVLFFYTVFFFTGSQLFQLGPYMTSPFVNEFILFVGFVVACFFCFGFLLRWVSVGIRRYGIEAQRVKARTASEKA